MTSAEPAVRVWAGGRHVRVSRAPAGHAGRLATAFLAALVEARRAGDAVCLLPPPEGGRQGLLALTSPDVERVESHGARGLWARAAWRAAAARHWSRRQAHDARVSFWRELSRELRRTAGDDARPDSLRAVLRSLTRSASARAAESTPPPRYPRRLLRQPVPVGLHGAAAREAEQALAAYGVDPSRPLVVIEEVRRIEANAAIVRYLQAEGYQVLRIGAAPGHGSTAGVVDLPGAAADSPAAVLALLRARFAVCASTELQQVACLTNTPTLRLDAPDPLCAHPVRPDSLYALSEIVDLDSGRRYGRDDQLAEGFFRNLRNCGSRGTPPGQALAAVQELHEALRGGWQESAGQTAFRARAAAAGAALAPRVPYAAQWGPDDGFLGDGRLARCQADRAPDGAADGASEGAL